MPADSGIAAGRHDTIALRSSRPAGFGSGTEEEATAQRDAARKKGKSDSRKKRKRAKEVLTQSPQGAKDENYRPTFVALWESLFGLRPSGARPRWVIRAIRT
jgi:hypothetical protein